MSPLHVSTRCSFPRPGFATSAAGSHGCCCPPPGMPAARTRPPATATSYYVAVQAAGRVALQLLHCPLPLAPGIPTPVAGQEDSGQIAFSTAHTAAGGLALST